MAVAGCSVGRPRERYATKQITKSANSFKTSEDACRWEFVLMNSALRKSAYWIASVAGACHNSKLLSMIRSQGWPTALRSEERRVGKECRYRGGREEEIKIKENR